MAGNGVREFTPRRRDESSPRAARTGSGPSRHQRLFRLRVHTLRTKPPHCIRFTAPTGHQIHGPDRTSDRKITGPGNRAPGRLLFRGCGWLGLAALHHGADDRGEHRADDAATTELSGDVGDVEPTTAGCAQQIAGQAATEETAQGAGQAIPAHSQAVLRCACRVAAERSAQRTE